MPIIIAIWVAVAGVVGHATYKDIKFEQAVKQSDKERVARNDDRELAAYLERLSVLRDGKRVAESLNSK